MDFLGPLNAEPGTVGHKKKFQSSVVHIYSKKHLSKSTICFVDIKFLNIMFPNLFKPKLIPMLCIVAFAKLIKPKNLEPTNALFPIIIIKKKKKANWCL